MTNFLEENKNQAQQDVVICPKVTELFVVELQLQMQVSFLSK